MLAKFCVCPLGNALPVAVSIRKLRIPYVPIGLAAPMISFRKVFVKTEKDKPNSKRLAKGLLTHQYSSVNINMYKVSSPKIVMPIIILSSNGEANCCINLRISISKVMFSPLRCSGDKMVLILIIYALS